MTTIQPIETKYKGYRFRSRLEARWAMFYDAIGVQWTYEPQPVRVDGEVYLPDFEVVLDGKLCRHEVKSAHEQKRIVVPKVYLAGKMKPEHNWRGEALSLDRAERSGILDHDLTDHPFGTGWLANARVVNMKNASFNLIGPFPLGCDHGCAHGANVAHMAETCNFDTWDNNLLLKTCVRTIQSADIVCAHFSTADAYGTLVELGIAKGQNPDRPLSVTVDANLAICLNKRNEHGHIETDHYDDRISWSRVRHDLWFATSLADESSETADNDAAQAFHAEFIRKHSTREFRKIAGIGRRHPAFLTFGDPLDVCAQGMSLAWQADIFTICRIYSPVAERIRAHRFDSF